jgi:hypothetical protein
MNDTVCPQLRAEVNKRMTMNMFIQGAAWQACLTGHHLIQNELNELSPVCNEEITNTEFYDRFATAVLIGQWNSEIAFYNGISSFFWNRVGNGTTDFCHHPLLVKHGKRLAKICKRKVLKRCREKGVWGQPVALSFHTAALLQRCREFENVNRFTLEDLATEVTCQIWGLEEKQVAAAITERPAFGQIRVPETQRGRRLKEIMVAWGGVKHLGDGKLQVVGQSRYWSLLIHELSKGAVELISLHGLNDLDDETYGIVMLAADNIEYEIWMMQSGLELYRLMLRVIPRGFPIAEALMFIAKMPAELHEDFTMNVIEKPDRAADQFLNFASA